METHHTDRNQLISMMEEFSLIDVYRNLNPNKLCFTYESKALKLSSRIDFYLVSQPLTNRVSHHGNFSFHRA